MSLHYSNSQDLGEICNRFGFKYSTLYWARLVHWHLWNECKLHLLVLLVDSIAPGKINGAQKSIVNQNEQPCNLTIQPPPVSTDRHRTIPGCRWSVSRAPNSGGVCVLAVVTVKPSGSGNAPVSSFKSESLLGGRGALTLNTWTKKQKNGNENDTRKHATAGSRLVNSIAGSKVVMGHWLKTIVNHETVKVKMFQLWFLRYDDDQKHIIHSNET